MPTSPTMTTPWYSEETGFFQDLYPKEYADRIDAETTYKQVDFVESLFSDCKGLNVLDLACGNGRHSIELARRGYSVTGLDPNGSLLDLARAGGRSAGVGVRWIRADMRRLPFGCRFDLVLSLFTSFGFFPSDREDQQAVRDIARVLKSGGRFVLDIMNSNFVLESLVEEETSRLSDGRSVRHRRRFDPTTKRLHHCRVIRANGRYRSWESIVRLYSPDELDGLCERSGLQVTATYGNYGSEPLAATHPRCIVVAERR